MKNRCLGCMAEKNTEDVVCPYCGWVEGSKPKESFHLHPNSILNDRYIIGVVLGYGGFGVTYKAWDTALAVQVAVKEFFPNGLVNRIPGETEVIIYDGEKRKQYENGLEGFLEEARNIAKFNNHPNIVKVSDYFLQNSTAYIVMEYLEGLTLNEYLSSLEEKVNYKDSIDIILPILQALKTIHKQHLVHRDVSPHNIMITTDNKIKLIDLGAARYSFAGHEKSLSVILKPGYAPPEQYRSKSKQGAFTDIYAAGATLYRMITGLVPEESVDRLIEDDLKKPSELDIELPGYIEKAIMKSLAIKESLRFQSIQDFIDAISSKKKVDYPEVELKKRKRLRKIIASVAAVIFLSVGSFLLFYKPIQLEEDTLAIWVPVNENTDLSKYEKISNKFTEDFSEIRVEIIGVVEENYKEELLIAKENGKLPDLFRSDLLPNDYIEYTKEVDELFNFIDIENFHFLDQYERWFPDKKQVPLGFNTNVLYAHAGLADDAQVGLYSNRFDKSDFYDTEKKYLDIYSYWFCINSNLYDEYILAIDNSAEYSYIDNEISLNEEAIQCILELYSLFDMQDLDMKNIDENLFCENEVGFLYGDTSIYNMVQKSLPGFYRVLPPPGDGMVSGEFTDKWSVSVNSTKNRQLASIIFLSYMLSDYAQDYLILQSNNSLPIRKETFERYIESNIDLEFLASYVDDIVYDEKNDKTINLFNRELAEYLTNTESPTKSSIKNYVKKYSN